MDCLVKSTKRPTLPRDAPAVHASGMGRKIVLLARLDAPGRATALLQAVDFPQHRFFFTPTQAVQTRLDPLGQSRRFLPVQALAQCSEMLAAAVKIQLTQRPGPAVLLQMPNPRGDIA